MRLDPAREWAHRFVQIISPGCEQVMIAGSIRREKSEVKDIEIVALPLWDQDLMGDRLESSSCLSGYIQRAIVGGALAWDTEKKANGTRYKRLRMLASNGAPVIVVDLFLVTPDNWGNILAIRTGDAEFSHLLVTPQANGGLMPPDFLHAGGYLRRRDPQNPNKALVACPIVPCRTESDFFEALGLVRDIDPARRSGFLARALGKDLSKRGLAAERKAS